MSKIVNWEKVKNEYIMTKISIKKLSEKYNINYSAIESRSKREKWGNLKKEMYQKLSEKCTEKTIDILAQKKVKIVESHFNAAEQFKKPIIEALKNPHELFTFVEKVKEGGKEYFKETLEEFRVDTINDRKVLNLVTSLEKLQKMQRQSLNILDIKDAKRIELEEKKIDSDKNIVELKESINNFLSAVKPSESEINDTFLDNLDED